MFGLDNRSVTHHNLADPPATGTITLPEVPDLYEFPAKSAAGQTIAIFSEGGYLSSDIAANFGGCPPVVTDVSVNASNSGIRRDNGETTQDIVIAASVAPGADVAVYFCGGRSRGGSTSSAGSCIPIRVTRSARCSRRASTSSTAMMPGWHRA